VLIHKLLLLLLRKPGHLHHQPWLLRTCC
jgi:hypothetical protein